MNEGFLPKENKGAEVYSRYRNQILISIKHYLSSIDELDFEKIICDHYDDFILQYKNRRVKICQVKCHESGQKRLSIATITKKGSSEDESILEKLIRNHFDFQNNGYLVSEIVLLTNGDLLSDLAQIQKFNVGIFRDQNEKESLTQKIKFHYDDLKKRSDLEITDEIFKKLRFIDRQGEVDDLENIIKSKLIDFINYNTSIKKIPPDIYIDCYNKILQYFDKATRNTSRDESSIEKRVIFDVIAEVLSKKEMEFYITHKLLGFKVGKANFGKNFYYDALDKIKEKYIIFATYANFSNFREIVNKLDQNILNDLSRIQYEYLGNINPVEINKLYYDKIELLVNNLPNNFQINKELVMKYAEGRFFEYIEECPLKWVKSE